MHLWKKKKKKEIETKIMIRKNKKKKEKKNCSGSLLNKKPPDEYPRQGRNSFCTQINGYI